MIDFVQLQQRRVETAGPKHEFSPQRVALILGLILMFQIGLVVWMFLRQL